MSEADCDQNEEPSFCLVGTIEEDKKETKETKNQWLGKKMKKKMREHILLFGYT